MAEPLSIAASIIAVIQITSRVAAMCYDYRAGLKSHSRDIKYVTEEITSLRDVLESILKLVDHEEGEASELSTLKVLTKPDGPLSSCKVQMLLLEKDLSPGTGLRAVARTLKWPYARGEVDKKVQELGRLKSSLTLAMTTDQTSDPILLIIGYR
jgi:hypothetical protein